MPSGGRFFVAIRAQMLANEVHRFQHIINLDERADAFCLSRHEVAPKIDQHLSASCGDRRGARSYGGFRRGNRRSRGAEEREVRFHSTSDPPELWRWNQWKLRSGSPLV